MRFMTVLLFALLATAPVCLAAEPLSAPAAPPSVQDSRPAAPDRLLGNVELEQLLAPVALYPDSLLAQVLMASTYPLEVVSASRWAKAHADLKDGELDEALRLQAWDPSVTSLVAFPEVLSMMDEKLDWTEKLGNAFLAQQQDCMDAVQRLRARAEAGGLLVSGKEQTVSVRKNTGSSSRVIVIEPTQPDVIYVPRYDPALVYGYWPYPAYPSSFWYPAGYVTTGNLLSFGAGIGLGYVLWGNLDWHRRHVYINAGKYSKFWRRPPFRPPDWRHGSDRPPDRHSAVRPPDRRGRDGGAPSWRHDPAHRKGVPYHNSSVRRQFRGRGDDTREQRRGQARQFFREYTQRDAVERQRQVYGNRGQRPARPEQPERRGRREDASGHRPGMTGHRPGDTRPASDVTGHRPGDRRPASGVTGHRPGDRRPASGVTGQGPHGQSPRPGTVERPSQGQRPHPGAARPRPQEQRPNPGTVRQRPPEQRPRPDAVKQRPQEQRPKPGTVRPRPPEQRPHPGAARPRPQEQRPAPGTVRQRPSEQRPRPDAVKQRPPEQRPKPGTVRPRPPAQRPHPGAARPRPQEQSPRHGAVRPRPQEQRPQPAAVRPRSQEQRPQPAAVKPRPPEQRPQPGVAKQRPQEQRSRHGAGRRRP